MCGIIAVLRRRSDRTPPTAGELLEQLAGRAEVLLAAPPSDLAPVVDAVAERAEQVDRLLRGTAGVLGLLADRSLPGALEAQFVEVAAALADREAALDAEPTDPAGLEATNAAVIRLKDALWAVQRDRLRTARAVADLAGAAPSRAAIEAFASVQAALSAIDRLEVRGRDSAGLTLLVRGHGLDLDDPAIHALCAARLGDPLFTAGAVRVTPEGHLSLVYKAAAEIGELGDNTRVLRDAIREDALLQRALVADTAEVTVLGHTRWASIGIISQPNAHPMNSDEVDRVDGPYVTAALNGDVDNFADLKVADELRIAAEITSDAKVIPTLVSRRLAAGDEAVEAFRQSVRRFDGSVAVAASVAGAPDRLQLALRGSGQALYVGLDEDLYVVASEPYGVVEDATRYFRLDGETPADPTDPSASRGQVVELDAALAGTVEGIRRFSYDGTELPVGERELVTPEVTTRDIDRGAFQHFLLKEITEAPGSFRKTLRGKIAPGADGLLRVVLGDDTLPPAVRADLASGAITRVLVIGQGTAAVAGQSLARNLTAELAATPVRVEALPATELSGFSLRADMADTLIVAISQSGTTTDTNRTVDLVRGRGARVIAIVNRRASDLTDKSDGVLYTSDGRDVEMSVASTKAFYAQIAAGFLLSAAIAQEVPGTADGAAHRSQLLAGLRELPTAMEATLARREVIAEAAQELTPSRRYWAIVGSGANRVAAEEIRIKLSELCYKAIASDAIEDKKHIDLSSEPLILVCAAGLSGSNADDVAKEVAIYRAHKATPIVIATEDEDRFNAALRVLTVPSVEPELAFVLTTVVGHLFGYEAALAIDAQARPLREARGAIEEAVSGPSVPDADRLLVALRPTFESVSARFHDGLRTGAYNGHLEAGTAVRLSSMFRYATGLAPLDAYQSEHGRVGTPSMVIEDLTAALTGAIEELTRPVDAIKHQAKTVTVGISRSDEGLLDVPLVSAALGAGAARDRLSYKALRTLAGLDAAVEEVVGYTRYRIEGDVEGGDATIVVVDRGGIARDLPLRTERNPQLRGTKHRVAFEREVTVAVGRSDGRSLVLIPEVKGNQCTGITLLHARFAPALPAGRMRSVLESYRDRYAALKDAVTETEPTFRDDLLGGVAPTELLTTPVNVLADRWRTGTEASA
ncbi:SIS domain-containing protein [Aquihabitans sp. G128]|uniref:SIS domain-containing protein n=1 Tax=Aquihabitans sp. G128 TaxID=2849779 RepID=UPI001C23CE02|nr:SIS domain-containing protein [Aquihabitans sp. G128]QXC60345.1 SIS domain-containing protein [Aquihabitans sp. G128]